MCYNLCCITHPCGIAAVIDGSGEASLTVNTTKIIPCRGGNITVQANFAPGNASRVLAFATFSATYTIEAACTVGESNPAALKQPHSPHTAINGVHENVGRVPGIPMDLRQHILRWHIFP